MQDWTSKLSFFNSDQYTQIVEFLDNERKAGKNILPEEKNIFNSLKYTKFEDLKVVILGQDPYPKSIHAMGLSFSIPEKCEMIPPSLKNIMKELKDDLNIFLNNGSLVHWAKQGVLLLNTILTVEEGNSNSHKSIGWKKLTKEIIELINTRKEHVVFILWGNFAQNLCKKVDPKKHLIIKSAHPSPLSSYRGFFGSKPFSRTNIYLKEHNITEIDW